MYNSPGKNDPILLLPRLPMAVRLNLLPAMCVKHLFLLSLLVFEMVLEGPVLCCFLCLPAIVCLGVLAAVPLLDFLDLLNSPLKTW